MCRLIPIVIFCLICLRVFKVFVFIKLCSSKQSGVRHMLMKDTRSGRIMWLATCGKVQWAKCIFAMIPNLRCDFHRSVMAAMLSCRFGFIFVWFQKSTTCCNCVNSYPVTHRIQFWLNFLSCPCPFFADAGWKGCNIISFHLQYEDHFSSFSNVLRVKINLTWQYEHIWTNRVFSFQSGSNFGLWTLGLWPQVVMLFTSLVQSPGFLGSAVALCAAAWRHFDQRSGLEPPERNRRDTKEVG